MEKGLAEIHGDEARTNGAVSMLTVLHNIIILCDELAATGVRGRHQRLSRVGLDYTRHAGMNVPRPKYTSGPKVAHARDYTL